MRCGSLTQLIVFVVVVAAVVVVVVVENMACYNCFPKYQRLSDHLNIIEVHCWFTPSPWMR